MKNHKISHIDLSYLLEITKSNSKLVFKMISIFLKETPPMIDALKNSFKKRDWEALHAETHNLIPTFRIIGMNEEFGTITQKIHEYNGEKENFDEIKELIIKLEADCKLVYKELNEELKIICV